jgi:hypothetical protein
MEAVFQHFGNMIQSKDMCYSSLITRNSNDSYKRTWIKGTDINYQTTYKKKTLTIRPSSLNKGLISQERHHTHPRALENNPRGSSTGPVLGVLPNDH